MSGSQEPNAIDSAKYRQVLGHFPTGVTVVAAVGADGPVGMAIGSFSSLSLDPAQILFCPSKSSTSWGHIRSAGRFCVNILAEDQEEISRVFASKADDKFAGLGWRRSPNGSPLLDGVVASIDCEIASVLDGGDHDIVVGRVTDLEVRHEGGPLVFFRGGYGRVSL